GGLLVVDASLTACDGSLLICAIVSSPHNRAIHT
ncbi:TPA: DNA polymerase V, partial [Citrobacter freundii]|nr:DNA polymerase V [Citrobacter freundii]